MSREDHHKNKKQKVQLDRGNQIITYEQEPTTWININQDELPEDITNQAILKIFEYRQNNDGQSKDITVIEENVIHETETSTSSIQTDYKIDIHRYSKEKIKPYFLSYLQDNHNKQLAGVNSREYGNRSSEFGKTFDDDCNSLVDSSVSKIDGDTQVTPNRTSSSPLGFTNSSTNRALKDNKIVTTLLNLQENNLVAPESSNNQKVDTCKSEIKTENCLQFIQNQIFDHNTKEESIPVNMTNDAEDTTAAKCSPPVDCCGPPRGRKSCDDDDEVNILCKKGDVKFKLRCKKIDGNTKDCDKLGNEVRYECEIVPEPNQCIDKAILESCDLKCSMISADKYDYVPHNIKHDINDQQGKQCDPPPPKSPPTPPPSSTPPPSDAGSCPPCPPSSSNPKLKIFIKPTEAAFDSMPPENKSCDYKVEAKNLEKDPQEKVIFACRSKSKMHDDRVTSECPPKSFDEIAAAMVEAHGRTMATLRVAADDIICNVSNTISKTKTLCEDPCAMEKVKQSAEDFYCELQKRAKDSEIQEKVETAYQNSCNTIRKLQKSTKDAIKEASYQTKKALGYKVEKMDEEEEEEMRCRQPRQPCRPTVKKTSCSRDNSGTDLAEAVRSSVEQFYDSVCKSTREATDAVSDLASQSIRVFGLETDNPPLRGSGSPDDNNAVIIAHKSAERLVFDVHKQAPEVQNISVEDRVEAIKSSAENVFNKLGKTTEKIAECTQEACNEIAAQSKKIFGYHEDSIDLQSRKENIKTMLSGLRLFKQNESEKEDETKENVDSTPGFVESALISFRSSLESLSSLEFDDESSVYDKPTPPKTVALIPSGTTAMVTGMFASIKDKFFSMFYDKESDDISISSDSSSDDDKSLVSIPSIEGNQAENSEGGSGKSVLMKGS